MKQLIAGTIAAFVKADEKRHGIATRWGNPIVGFADAKSSAVLELKDAVSPNHLLPEDVLADATVVIVYILPFTRNLAEKNCSGTAASPA